jgi:hypothetical protein
MTNPYGDEPTRAYGRPEYEDPAYGEPAPQRRQVFNSGQFFAGVAATALVAALAGWIVTAILQSLANRMEWESIWIYGLADPWTGAVTGFIAAVLSGVLIFVLAQGVPSARTFYLWIATLIVIAAVVLPFLTVGATLPVLGAAILHLVLGVVIISLTDVVASRTVRV